MVDYAIDLLVFLAFGAGAFYYFLVGENLCLRNIICAAGAVEARRPAAGQRLCAVGKPLGPQASPRTLRRAR